MHAPWTHRLGLIWLLLALAGPAYAQDATQRPHAPDRLIEGARALAARDAYLAHCAGCHGEAGGGSGLDSDFSTPEAVARLSREDMIEAARRGHDLTVSAAWNDKLDEAGLAAVIAYIRDALMLPAPVADASPGRRIYARTCSVCHGERGNGASWAQNSLNPPPFDFTAERGRRLSRNRMIHSVTYGRSGTAMMPFTTQLSRAEIAAVVDYVRATFLPRSETVAAVAKHDHGAHDHGTHDHDAAGGEGGAEAPFPDGRRGDAAAGERFYARNCAECHGLNGDGQGPRAYFMIKKPVAFTSAKARAEFNRPHLFTAIADGVPRTAMPAWSKVIGPRQIADVAEYVYRAFIRPSAAASGDDGPVVPGWRAEAAADGAKKKP